MLYKLQSHNNKPFYTIICRHDWPGVIEIASEIVAGYTGMTGVGRNSGQVRFRPHRGERYLSE